jgi:putative tryptophan/tyrosine transport system substrate-binding protein
VKAHRIVELTLKDRLPTMFGLIGAVESGGLMSYLPGYTDMYRRGAALVDKILKGTSLPISPSNFRPGSSWQYALGLQVPADLRVCADEVVE